jgi:hypothetical protein
VIWVLCEDNASLRVTIESYVKSQFPEIELQAITSEFDFMETLHTWKDFPPSAFIIDVMLRWSRNIEASPPTPSWYGAKDRYRAGLRIANLLLATEELAASNLIFYTVKDLGELQLEMQEFGLHIHAVPKHESLESLFRSVNRAKRTDRHR